MTKIKSLLMAAAVSTGVAFAMPAASQAMPLSGPVKVQAVKDGNLLQVDYKKKWKKKSYYKKKKWRESRKWRHHRRYARYYCDPWDGCYRRRHVPLYYPYWYEPYYGYGYPYYGYGPGFYGPGIGFSFRIH